MKDRIIEFLRAENKSSAQFAAEIGVQPSGISHILSGRNNPSLDFVIRMLEKYKYLSTEWLLFGKGKMFKEKQDLTLFDNIDANTQGKENNEKEAAGEGFSMISEIESSSKNDPSLTANKSGLKKIVWFYENNEFEIFSPKNDKLFI